MLSPCGCDCQECKEYKQSCAGCREIDGKVFWAGYMDASVCPMYDCSINKKQIEHCGQCGELPCKLFYDTRDPSVSPEEHEAGIISRAANLKKM